MHGYLVTYIHARMQYVEIDGYKSALRMLRIGVPQGSILGSLLFLPYINDLANINNGIRLILFANDTICLSQKLQDTGNFVSEWLTSNRLRLNIIKTKFMLFTMCNVSPPAIALVEKEVECVDSIKFLGCVVDTIFSWHAHVTYTCNRISRGIALLRHVRNFFPV